jgi:hypothetical protein
MLRESYPDPLPFDSAESFARYHHDDIAPALADEDLEDERFLAHLRRALERRARREVSAWLRERIARLDAEAARRRQRGARR